MSVTCFFQIYGATHYRQERNDWGGRPHSPPPESGDSVDRMDMARRNFENDPADVRAAVPRELMRRTICCAGDFGDTASSPGLNRVSTLSRF